MPQPSLVGERPAGVPTDPGTGVTSPARTAARALLRRYFRVQMASSRSEYLFVLGHMRSGSSMLMHVLNTNPGVIGYGETHTRYRSHRQLDGLLYRVLRSFGRLRLTERYVVDKLLHDRLLPDLSLLNHPKLRFVFLIRRSEDTIPSIVKLGRYGGEVPSTNYYVSRLATIETYARAIGDRRRAYFLTYEQLVGDAEAELQALTRFLELPHPLTSEYELHWATGRGGIGDPSEQISSGRIVATAPRTEAELSDDTILRGKEAFTRCCTVLSRECTTASNS